MSKLGWARSLSFGFAAALFVLAASSLAAAEPPLQRGKGPRPPSGVYRDRVDPHWFAQDTKFWYRNNLKSGTKEFVLVDAEKGTRALAFDHAKLASALGKAVDKEYRADQLPFSAIEFTDDAKAVRFDAAGKHWECQLDTYACAEGKPSEKKDEPSSATQVVVEGRPESPWVDDSREEPVAFQQPRRDLDRARSPDGKWTALIKEFNVVLRDANGNETPLTKDGKEGHAYGRPNWSPDSRSLVAFRIEPGDRKEVHLIESSPPGGGRAILSSRPYPLPGDKFPLYELHAFDIETRKDLPIEDRTIAFASGYETPRLRWNKDGHTFSYQRTQRGHQRFRLVEVDAGTGQSRNLIDEKSETFIWTAHYDTFTFPVITWLGKTDEIIYVSEKSGWRQLHLLDAKTGHEKNDITPGEFVVRGVDRIDEDKRLVWFRASGKNPDQDPYFIHYYRVNFDGTGLVALTEGNGTHSVAFSPTRKYLIDTFSRVDQAPITELRRADDGKLMTRLEEADITDLQARGWKPYEAFTAKGRDGTTDIWGIVARPRGLTRPRSTR